MNKKFKNILILVIGIIIGSTICVIGSNVISANQIGFNSSKTTKTNIQDAIDELYQKANKPENTSNKWKLEGVKAIIYLDPTNLSKKCNEDNSVSTPGTKTGCMKWYAFKEDNTSYTMILDHNSTSKVAYNSTNSNSAPKEVQTELNNLVSVSGWKVTPRLITAQEVANIIEYTAWTASSIWVCFDNLDQQCWNIYDGGVNIGKGNSKYSWLFDYIYSCEQKGCNIQSNDNLGYWTSTPSSSSTSTVWNVNQLGMLHGETSANNSGLGLRPVITISKSQI